MRWVFTLLMVFGFSLLFPLGSQAVETPAEGDSCMVVSAHPLATELGISILRSGGNAVDAAVVISFCLAGCEPYSSGLGGGGFFVFFDPETSTVSTLDARETAPISAHRDMYLVNGKPDAMLSRDGPLAVGVPGLVAGLKELHLRGGQLPWSELVNTAANAIREIKVTAMLQERIQNHSSRFNGAARKVFSPGGETPAIGSVLQQEDLFRTLQEIAQFGPDAFYKGRVAEAMVKVTARGNEVGITLADLAAYQPRWRKPIRGQYHDLEVFSMAPPSSGGIHLVEMLNILERFDLRQAGFGSVAAIHLLAEAMKFAYADRSLYLGDSDFVQVPVERLIGKARADSLGQLIQLDRAYPESRIQGAPLTGVESHETTHFSIVDTEGMAVAATLTINLTFGSGRMAPGTGVLMNNEMDDFVAAPGTPNAFGLVGGEANSIAPGKRPLSSMTPTIVLQDGRVRMVTGAPGGSKIITTTLQTILNVVDHKMDVLQAVSAPRVHHQWFPRRLYYEEFRMNVDTVRVLESMGHTVTARSPMCNAQVITVDPETGMRQGASDPRGMGLAAGF